MFSNPEEGLQSHPQLAQLALRLLSGENTTTPLSPTVTGTAMNVNGGSSTVRMEHVYGQSQGLETTFESGIYVSSYHSPITFISLSSILSYHSHITLTYHSHTTFM